MSEDHTNLKKIISYMKTHWPSLVRDEWQIKVEDYPVIAMNIVQDWTKDKTKGREFVRIAGQSGSGKTTQLLPAVEEYFKTRNKKPILVAARNFVAYHPFMEEIKQEYGENNLRKMTDEFSTIMMFLVLKQLIVLGYDLILDVTLLDPEMEKILVGMLTEAKYDFWMTMVAVSPETTNKFLGNRAWRHSQATEKEFIRATELAIKFYARKSPNMRLIIWNVWGEGAVYDGGIANGIKVWEKYIDITDIPRHDEEKLRQAKMKYFAKL